MTPSTQDARATGLVELAERVEAGKGCDNATDVEVEIALFAPCTLWSAIRPNAAGTKLIGTRQSGGERTFWAGDWTMNRPRTVRLLRALAASTKDMNHDR